MRTIWLAFSVALVATPAFAGSISNAEYNRLAAENAKNLSELEATNTANLEHGRNLLAGGCLERVGPYDQPDCYRDKTGHFFPGYSDGASNGGSISAGADGN